MSDMPSDDSISVVIPTYQRRTELPRVLRPLLADPVVHEVVVVVDGCDDGTWEMLTEWADRVPRLRPIYQANSGEGPARQAGVEAAICDVVLILDDDVVAGPGLAAGHQRHHSLGRRRVVLGYMPTSIPRPRRPGDVVTHLYAKDYERACLLYESDPELIFPNFWAGNFSMRRCDALAVGLASDSSLKYHADLEFGIRCLKAGLTPVFDRRLLARHEHRRSLNAFERQSADAATARALLAAIYPSDAPGADPMDDVTPFVRLLVRFLSMPWWADVVSAGLRRGTYWAGSTRLWGVETALARLLRQLWISRTVRDIAPPRDLRFRRGYARTASDNDETVH